MQYITLLCNDQPDVELIPPKHLQKKSINCELQGNGLFAAIWRPVFLKKIKMI